MSSICAARLRASARTCVDETIARGRGLKGDRAGTGGERFGVLGCCRRDEEGPYTDFEVR
jgi:hypothetical protein